MTQASVGNAPRSRLARDEQSMATVQHSAAPKPPMMAVIGRSPSTGGRGSRQTPAGTARSTSIDAPVAGSK